MHVDRNGGQQDVAVQVYDAEGNGVDDPIATKLTLQPGETKMFGTIATFMVTTDEDLGLAAITNGSARILSTDKGLVCSAFVANLSGPTPMALVTLPLFKSTKQQGD